MRPKRSGNGQPLLRTPARYTVRVAGHSAAPTLQPRVAGLSALARDSMRRQVRCVRLAKLLDEGLLQHGIHDHDVMQSVCTRLHQNQIFVWPWMACWHGARSDSVTGEQNGEQMKIESGEVKDSCGLTTIFRSVSHDQQNVQGRPVSSTGRPFSLGKLANRVRRHTLKSGDCPRQVGIQRRGYKPPEPPGTAVLSALRHQPVKRLSGPPSAVPAN